MTAHDVGGRYWWLVVTAGDRRCVCMMMGDSNDTLGNVMSGDIITSPA